MTEDFSSAVESGRRDLTRFRVGRGLALVAPPTYVLVDPTNGAFGERLWSLMEEDGGVDELLEELSAAGLRSLGDFAMAQIEGDELRVIVRGQAQASVINEGDSFDLEAGSVKTWVETVYEGVTGFALSIGEQCAEELVYRLERGIVPADQLHWGEFQRTVPRMDGVEMDWVDGFESTDVGRRQASLPSVGSSEVVTPDTAIETEPEADEDSDPDGSPDVADDEYDFDALYGRTVAKSVQGAAVAAAIEEARRSGPSDDSVSDGGESPDGEGDPVDDRTLAPLQEDEAGSGLIDSMPAGSGPGISRSDALPEPHPGGPAAEPQLGDHDGRTISASLLGELRERAGIQRRASESASFSGPVVQAFACSEGHLNPTHLSRCGQCDRPLEGPPVMVPRPSLGQIVFSTGRIIELDRPAIVGRSPKVQGSMPNEMPRLVTLEGDDLLSRSHLMIKLKGWHVLVEDLGSRNGTTVALPGQEPKRLIVGDPVILEPGAVIQLSENMSATFRERG